MITLGFKIGFVAFVAVVTFAALFLILVTILAALGRDYERKKEKRESSKVTQMPRRDD